MSFTSTLLVSVTTVVAVDVVDCVSIADSETGASVQGDWSGVAFGVALGDVFATFPIFSATTLPTDVFLDLGRGGFVISDFLASVVAVTEVLFDSFVTPVTAILTGRGFRGAATGLARTFTVEVTLLVLC